MDENMKMIGKVLLLVGGLVHLVPQLYAWLATIQVAGLPIIQVIVGLLSVVIAIMWLMDKK